MALAAISHRRQFWPPNLRPAIQPCPSNADHSCSPTSPTLAVDRSARAQPLDPSPPNPHSPAAPSPAATSRHRRTRRARGFLVWGLSRSFGRAPHLFPSAVSLFDLKARFFVPTRASLMSARAGAVKVGRRTNLAACSAVTRPHLDSSEHDGTLGAIGMTIRGEPACGRGSIAPQPCIRWVQGPEP
jgi:hypothetical protein